ncbi:ATP-binding cassette domain-containing protein [Streptomyces gossypii]
MHTEDGIRISGAREHNLQDVSLRIPRGKITVFTGVSGSGKSSVVFDTVAVESQRQLAETFTWFVRNRLPRQERPKADAIERLSPAIVVDQRRLGGGARSTVGTVTDIHAVLRVLFSRCGTPSAGEASAYSFNDPGGMCPGCDGLGRVVRLDLDRALDTSKSLNGGAILFPPAAIGTAWWQIYGESGLFDPDKPLARYDDREWQLLLHGKGFSVKRRGSTGTYNNVYDGLVVGFERLYVHRDLSTRTERVREMARRYTHHGVCPRCAGARLAAPALASRLLGRNIAEMAALEIGHLIGVLKAVEGPVGEAVAAQAVASLERVEGIGLGYLSLDRETSTLSGGEGQRLRMVRHLGSSLTGMTYIFDEPTTGLHPGDVARLGDLLLRLRDKGNTVLVVEHDPDVIAVADHVVDMGPGAGTRGGHVMFEGTPEQLAAADTPTGRGLRRVTGVKREVRELGEWLTVSSASSAAPVHNLKDVTLSVPTGVLTVVTGPAGSGKSTLVSEVFVAAHPEAIVVDQSAIGGSVRSTPASYLGVLDAIRRAFGKANAVAPGHFSFNSAGACPGCRGRGEIQTDLAFMDPVTTTCEACGGRRFTDAVLAMKLRGKSIADVLELTAGDAVEFFAADEGQAAQGELERRLRALVEVGLGYLTLGQPVSTLSGGERQRLKLATRLHLTGSLYVLDEPTTGLHMTDVDALLALLDRLVGSGNTVVVIEHDPQVVKHADWVVDLGPGGGMRGGEIVFTGTPGELLGHPTSLTALHLRRTVDRTARPDHPAGPPVGSR